MPDAVITIAEEARAKILDLRSAEEQEALALRIEILGKAGSGFRYDLQFVPETEKNADDVVVDGGGFQVFVDPKSAADLKGSRLVWVESQFQSGFKIENPNPVWSDPAAVAVQTVIDEKINPGVAGHGGYVTLLDVKGDTAYISLGGGCQGCGMAAVTLKQGIEVMIKEGVPAIRDVVDTTDHAGGTNPYYQPSKGGESPYS